MATFRSPNARLQVAFPPDEFGFNEVGGKKSPHKPVMFEGGIFTTDDAGVIERLRKHPAGQETSSTGRMFEEDSEELVSLVRKTQPKGAVVPAELTPEDRALLKEAEALANSLNKANLPKGRKVAERLIERFNLSGVDDFTNVSTPNGGKSVLLSLLDVIEQQIQPEEDADQGGDRAS